MKTKIPPEFVAAYCRKEMTIYDISEEIDKSPSTVYNALVNEGVDTTSHRRRKQDRNERVVAARKNETLERVGAKFGITKERVRQIVAKARKEG